jgi:type I restriction enzyme S subunit
MSWREMNKDWKEVKLGDVVNVNGETVGKDDDYSFVNYLDTGSVTAGKIEEIKYLDPMKDKIPSRAKRKVSKGDVIISTVRPSQRHYGIIKDIPENFLVSTGFAVLSAKQDLLDSSFLYYFLTQERVEKTLSSIAQSGVSTYPSIKPSDLEEMLIKLPPLPEQKRISSILSSLDAKIELNNKINNTLEEIGKTIFKHWFVDFEFPWDFKKNEFSWDGKPYKSSGGKMVDSKLGKIPEGWEVKSLDDIADYLNGKPLQRFPETGDDTDIPVIKIRELRDGFSDSTDYANDTVPQKYIIKNGDILFSWSGSLYNKDLGIWYWSPKPTLV